MPQSHVESNASRTDVAADPAREPELLLFQTDQPSTENDQLSPINMIQDDMQNTAESEESLLRDSISSTQYSHAQPQLETSRLSVSRKEMSPQQFQSSIRGPMRRLSQGPLTKTMQNARSASFSVHSNQADVSQISPDTTPWLPSTTRTSVQVQRPILEDQVSILSYPNQISGYSNDGSSSDEAIIRYQSTSDATGSNIPAKSTSPITTINTESTFNVLQPTAATLSPASLWESMPRRPASTLSINTNMITGTAPGMTRQASYRPSPSINGPRSSEVSNYAPRIVRSPREKYSPDTATDSISAASAANRSPSIKNIDMNRGSRVSKSSRHSTIGSPTSPLTIRKNRLEFLTRPIQQPKWTEISMDTRFILRLVQLAINAGCFYALASCAFQANYSSRIIPLSGIDLLCFTTISTGFVSAAAIITYLFPAQLSIPPNKHQRVSRVEVSLELGCIILWLTSSVTFGSSSPAWMRSEAWYACFVFAILAGLTHGIMLGFGILDIFANSKDAASAPGNTSGILIGAKGTWAATSADPYDENEVDD